MNFRQFYLGCLSHASYYIGSDGEAVVIDPQRDVDQYLAEAQSHGEQIRYIIETHSHADFVSGHAELAAKTGARIIYGQRANTQFETYKVKDGDEIRLGSVKLSFLETPGHTPEGITIVAEDTADPAAPLKVFTGDTLFIGDVGRPDLVGSKGFTSEQMAGMLYDSLYDKILKLPDTAEIYPAHGAGSLCGKSLSKETWSTLGEQRRFNYALQPMSKEQFVKIVAADQPEVPAYFPRSAARNLEGASSLRELTPPHELDSDELRQFDGVVIDVRSREDYGSRHIPNSINIGLGGQFASWAGTLIPIGTPIAVIAETNDQVDEAQMRLARVGHDTVAAFILIDSYKGDLKTIDQVPVETAAAGLGKKIQLIDVRRPAEFTAGHAPGAVSIPLDKLAGRLDEIDPAIPTFVICEGGYRSSIGGSILENAGVDTIYNVTGGMNAWLRAGLETELSVAAKV